MEKLKILIPTMQVLIITVFTTVLTIVFSHYFLYHDEDLLIAKMIVNRPEVFQLSGLKRKEIVKLMQDYRNMTSTNFETFKHGDTYESSKKTCINEILDTVRRTIVNGETIYDDKGYAPANIGGPTNPFLINAINPEKMSDQESKLYMNNIGKILNALPKNIPGKSTLTKFEIHDIRYLDKFAKITFVEDIQAEKLIREGEIYRGQF